MIAHLVFSNKYASEKLVLPFGKTVLGRGPLLKITDKRVSRSHAVIINDENKLLLKSLCKYPTYYCPPGLEEVIPLKYNEECVLANAGKISFLPDDLIFQVIIEEEANNDPEEMKSFIQQSTNHSLDEDIFLPTTGTNFDVSSRKRVLPQWMTDLKEAIPLKKVDKKKVLKTQKSDHQMQKSDAHAKMTNNSNTDMSIKNADSKCNVKVVNHALSTEKNDNDDVNDDNDGVNDDNDDVNDDNDGVNNDNDGVNDDNDGLQEDTQLKTIGKCSLSKSISEEVSVDVLKEETQIMAVRCSNLAETRLSTLDDVVNTSPEVNPKQTCPYGSACYRKNPLHFKEYNHLSDELTQKKDIKAKEKPLCEYGSTCYRKNLQHWQDYIHPSSNENKKVKPKRSCSKQSKNIEYKENEDSENDENKYDLNDSFIDDEVSDDDYAPDSVSDSDEYDVEDKDND
ncbi:aprataxin and PNK-like factor isoform X2 [Hydra vulgaris]|uniref:aprataxin and PNK-like factor isoform X2 n=1 Tax=Hydra vulgaris TaxID=6087 RepID=UPI001F5F1659|nr:aprataxin and PNK-like factor isoform X2 [Hydra vulgaris]